MLGVYSVVISDPSVAGLDLKSESGALGKIPASSPGPQISPQVTVFAKPEVSRQGTVTLPLTHPSPSQSRLIPPMSSTQDPTPHPFSPSDIKQEPSPPNLPLCPPHGPHQHPCGQHPGPLPAGQTEVCPVLVRSSPTERDKKSSRPGAHSSPPSGAWHLRF